MHSSENAPPSKEADFACAVSRLFLGGDTAVGSAEYVSAFFEKTGAYADIGEIWTRRDSRLRNIYPLPEKSSNRELHND